MVDPVGFAVVGWSQAALALALLLVARRRPVLLAAGAVNALALTLWVLSRTVGLPVGSHAGVVEQAQLADSITAGFEGLALLVTAVLLVSPTRFRAGPVVPSVVAVAALGLATVPLVAGDGVAGAPHDDGSAHAAQMAAVDAVRCDMGFNPRSYWETARAMGVDTYTSGSMAPHALRGTAAPAAASGDSHAGHGGSSATSLLDQLRAPDPLDGARTPGLDRLISATDQADGGEVAAARLVEALASASTTDYDAWVEWSFQSAASSGGHDHAASSAAAPDDNGGHGGHAGPQPWTAMVDPSQCVQLNAELRLARATALRYPTAADAMAGGWKKVTSYVPGIAAHYMKFSIVDGTFKVDEPEMLLYDGEGPDAHIVGLSYYMRHDGDTEPTQGFTGPNDHFHRHVGLCTSVKSGIVVGDSTTTPEQCAALGGRKANGSGGWMSHAWVVPGCESPWGVFSAASPILDSSLPKQPVAGRAGCRGNLATERYDLSPGERPSPAARERASGG
ncbi:MAG: hypothetical protein ACKO04_00865 [Actinomycetes bacterium]